MSLAFPIEQEAIEMDLTGIAKSHQVGIRKMGKMSTKRSDSLREKITGCGAERLYGNKFLTLRKSQVAKVAPDRAGFSGILVDWGASGYQATGKAKVRQA